MTRWIQKSQSLLLVNSLKIQHLLQKLKKKPRQKLSHTFQYQQRRCKYIKNFVERNQMCQAVIRTIKNNQKKSYQRNLRNISLLKECEVRLAILDPTA